MIDRISKLEKEVSRLKRVNKVIPVVSMVLSLVVVGLFSNSIDRLTADNDWFPVIKAEKIVLVNSQGEQRAVFGVFNGEPAIGLFDRYNKLRLDIRINNSYPMIRMNDSMELPKIDLSDDVIEGPRLVMTDMFNTKRVGIGVVDNDTSAVSLFDSYGRSNVDVLVKNNKSTIRIYNRNSIVWQAP